MQAQDELELIPAQPVLSAEQRYEALPTEVRTLFSSLLPLEWTDPYYAAPLDSDLGQAIWPYLSGKPASRAKSGFATYFNVGKSAISTKIQAYKAAQAQLAVPSMHAHAFGPGDADSIWAQDPAGAAHGVRISEQQQQQQPTQDVSIQRPAPFFVVPLDVYYEQREEYRASGVYPEHQCRLRPYTFLEGPLAYPISNGEYITAPDQTLDVPYYPQTRDSILADKGFYGVNLRSSLEKSLSANARKVLGSLSMQHEHSYGLMLDTVQQGEKFPRGLVRVHGFEKLNEHISLDHVGRRFDENRRQLGACNDENLNQLCAEVHQMLVPDMPNKFHSEFDEEYKLYIKEHASALGSAQGAKRQCFHPDTNEEGLIAAVALESDIRIVVLENSHILTRRIFSLWEEWKKNGLKPFDIDEEEWWDYTCWRQLVQEGWGSRLNLQAKTIVIPKGHAMIFSSFLIHAGAEWRFGDFEGFNRLHFYMTPYKMSEHPDSVNMHSRARAPKQTSFSPALRFMPRPTGAPEPPGGAFPAWVTKASQGTRRRKRTVD